MYNLIRHIRLLLLTVSLLTVSILHLSAQEPVEVDTLNIPAPSSPHPDNSPLAPSVGEERKPRGGEVITPLPQEEQGLQAGTSESASVGASHARDWSTWKPDPKRAMWLAMVIPGAGQIYNHKYWKLPIVYGGFVGCAYAMRWNNMMYHDYAQAYMDLLDNDPQTDSYNQFMHLGAEINSSNQARYEKLFKARKDRFRRWRDMSFFVLIGVYAISVVDAYVDASLSEFDISDDLSMRIEPTIINDQLGRNPLKSNALGLQCSVSF